MTKAVPEAFRYELPLLRLGEEVATTKIGRVLEAVEEVAWIETNPHGVVVPMPTWPMAVNTHNINTPETNMFLHIFGGKDLFIDIY